MSIARAQYGIKPVKSENKWGRSNRRHFSGQNHRKKTSSEYEKKPRKLVLSRFTDDGWLPCPSGYTRGQGWGLLHKSWIGYKRALNPRNGETFQERLRWAVTIQNIQTDLGLQRTSFPTLGLHGDYIFSYNESKQMELEDLENELFLEEWKKKRRVHIQEIVDTTFLSQEEIEWLQEGFISTYPTFQQTFDPISRRYVERVTMV